MNVNQEIWKPVALYDNYEVSNFGNIRTVAQRPHSHFPAGFILKPTKHYKNGYMSVMLWGSGKPKRVMVHQLVLRAFVGPDPEGCETRHLDGVRSNNRLDNLMWGTHPENESDKKIHGTSSSLENNGSAKLDCEKVGVIKSMLSQKVPQYKIGKAFGVSQGAISMISRGLTWRGIGV